LLGIARLLIACPRFAFLDRATNALSPSRVKYVYEILSQTSISYITFGDQPILRDYHDMVLEIQEDGQWTTGPNREPRWPDRRLPDLPFPSRSDQTPRAAGSQSSLWSWSWRRRGRPVSRIQAARSVGSTRP